MKYSHCLALSLALLLPAAAQATPVNFDGGWYVRIDGHYYSANAGTINIGSGQISMGTLVASLSNCRRPGGAAQTVTSSQLIYANGTRVVYLPASTSQYALTLGNGATVLTLVSATADIICDGEQAPPSPGQVFTNSFE